MILKTKNNKEFYPTGQLKYVETIAIIAPLWRALYRNKRIADDGNMWIRIGDCIKYNKNGSVQWSLKYDNHGEVV